MKKSMLLVSLLAVGMLVGCGTKKDPSSSAAPSTSDAAPSSSEVAPSEAPSTSDVTPSEAPSTSATTPVGDALAVYDFTTLTGSESLTDKTFGATFEKKVTGTNVVASYSNVSKVYNGNGTGGAKPDAEGLIKMGASKAQGTFTLTLNDGVTVSKVVVSFHSFYALSDQYPENTTNFLAVNGVSKAAPYNAEATPEEVTFDITASGTITFTSQNADGSGAGRVCLYSVALYA